MAAKRILVVEDNPDNARLAQHVLELYGMEVSVVNRAESGIELARTDKPDLILMDISLPGMDGLEATAILKKSEDTWDIPIIALTAHAMQGDRERCLAAGCDGFLTKPINVAAIADQIKPFLAA